MDHRFLIKLAAKNLALHKLRSLLTITAMVIGISAILFLVAFAFGVEKLVTSEVTGGDAYELVDVGTGNSQIIKLNQESIQRLGAVASVKTVEYVSNAAASINNLQDKPIDTGFFLSSTKYLDWLGYKLKAGRYFERKPDSEKSETEEVVVNESFLKIIGAQKPQDAIGKEIQMTLIIPKELRSENSTKNIENQKFTIVGVIKGPVSESAFVDNSLAQKYEISNFSQAKVRITPRDKVESSRKQIENLGFKTQFIGETVAQVEQVFSFFKIILGSFGLIALIVASLGMFNTLTISLLERTKEVALLKIIGMNKKDIVRIFLTEAITMGILGGILGICIGFVLAKIANVILNTFATRAGGDPVAIFYFPLWFVISMMLFALGVSLFTGLYPAKRAAKIKALDVLRYE